MVLFDGEDIILILEGHVSLRESLNRKVKMAQTKGHIFVHPITGDNKIKQR